MKHIIYEWWEVPSLESPKGIGSFDGIECVLNVNSNRNSEVSVLHLLDNGVTEHTNCVIGRPFFFLIQIGLTLDHSSR